jgi:hypothetical protein
VGLDRTGGVAHADHDVTVALMGSVPGLQDQGADHEALVLASTAATARPALSGRGGGGSRRPPNKSPRRAILRAWAEAVTAHPAAARNDGR